MPEPRCLTATQLHPPSTSPSSIVIFGLVTHNLKHSASMSSTRVLTCLLARRGFLMNLRVLITTVESLMVVICIKYILVVHGLIAVPVGETRTACCCLLFVVGCWPANFHFGLVGIPREEFFSKNILRYNSSRLRLGFLFTKSTIGRTIVRKLGRLGELFQNRNNCFALQRTVDYSE